jgi:hypothetical protein
MTHPDMTSPVDLPLPDEEEQHPLLWASIAIAVATGFLLLFNASALRGWAFDLEPGTRSERVVSLTDGWYRHTESLYLDRSVAAMSGWWDAGKALEFGSDPDAASTDRSADAADDSEAGRTIDEPEGPGFSVQ